MQNLQYGRTSACAWSKQSWWTTRKLNVGTVEPLWSTVATLVTWWWTWWSGSEAWRLNSQRGDVPRSKLRWAMLAFGLCRARSCPLKAIISSIAIIVKEKCYNIVTENFGDLQPWCTHCVSCPCVQAFWITDYFGMISQSHNCSQDGPPGEGEAVRVLWTDGKEYGGKFIRTRTQLEYQVCIFFFILSTCCLVWNLETRSMELLQTSLWLSDNPCQKYMSHPIAGRYPIAVTHPIAVTFSMKHMKMILSELFSL